MRVSANRCFTLVAPFIATHRSNQSQSTSACPWQHLVCLTASLLLLALSARPVQAADQAPTYPEFGAMESVGEVLEPCETEAQHPTASVIDSNANWQALIQAGQPNATFLLRGGVYTAADKPLLLPAGAPGQPVTIKPYNCEAVTLYASLRPRSYNVIAGLHIETLGIKEDRWAIRVDGKQYGHIEGVSSATTQFGAARRKPYA